MYVCVCHAVTDSQVRQAVHNGVTLMRELREELNVASSCGRCACCARDVLRATLKEIGAKTSPKLPDQFLAVFLARRPGGARPPELAPALNACRCCQTPPRRAHWRQTLSPH